MKEDFLHYLWKYQKFKSSPLQTTGGELIYVQNIGVHNKHSGPDFFNARVGISEQQWAGNVEIHLKSSDWYVHHHETDPAYDNVILHVVWEHDVEVFRKDETVIPTLELQKIVDVVLVQKYSGLLTSASQRWINCDTDRKSVV